MKAKILTNPKKHHLIIICSNGTYISNVTKEHISFFFFCFKNIEDLSGPISDRWDNVNEATVDEYCIKNYNLAAYVNNNYQLIINDPAPFKEAVGLSLPSYGEMISSNEFAFLHNISQETVKKYCRLGLLKCIKYRRGWLIDKSSVLPDKKAISEASAFNKS